MASVSNKTQKFLQKSLQKAAIHHKGFPDSKKPAAKRRKITSAYGPDSGESGEDDDYDDYTDSDYSDDDFSEESSSFDEFDDYVPSKTGIVAAATADGVAVVDAADTPQPSTAGGPLTDATAPGSVTVAPKSTSINYLLDKYRAEGPQEDPDPTTAPINDKLVGLIDKWFLGYCPPSEIRKLEDKAERPENVHSLKPLKVNAELYYTIHHDGIEADRNPQYVSTVIAKSAQPLTSAWASIFAADAAYMDANPGQKECTVQVTPDCVINLSQIRELLSMSLMLLGSANVQLALQCRASFKYYLHYDYHGLLHHSNALGAAQLFGATVKEKIGDLEKIKQVVHKVRRRLRKPHKNPSHRCSRSDFLGKQGGGGRRRQKRRRGYSDSSRSDNFRSTDKKRGGHTHGSKAHN